MCKRYSFFIQYVCAFLFATVLINVRAFLEIDIFGDTWGELIDRVFFFLILPVNLVDIQLLLLLSSAAIFVYINLYTAIFFMNRIENTWNLFVAPLLLFLILLFNGWPLYYLAILLIPPVITWLIKKNR